MKTLLVDYSNVIVFRIICLTKSCHVKENRNANIFDTGIITHYKI